MSTNDISLVSSSPTILNSQLIYHENPLGFTSHRPLGDPGPKTRELAGFIDDKLLPSSSSPGAANRYIASDQQHRRGPDVYRGGDRNWSANGNETSADDESDDEEEKEEYDDSDEDDEEAGGTVGVGVNGRSSGKHNGSNNEKTSNSDGIHGGGDLLEKMGNGNAKAKDFASYRSSGAVMVLKDGGDGGRTANAGVTIANLDGEMLYSRYLETADGSGGKRKDGSSLTNESGESLRAILSDPVTGALMDDAMILLCGHSFGNGGVQHALRIVGSKLCCLLFSGLTICKRLDKVFIFSSLLTSFIPSSNQHFTSLFKPCLCAFRGTDLVLTLTELQKSCYTCSRPVSEESISPNLALRAAVQAYRREEELQSFRSPKRKRDRFEERGSYGDANSMDPPRGRGVQFPFSVTDRVIIKGNKRTPERFVGREAIVTTQCLNGWYVVKTLDNAESVKLQYRSLAKVTHGSSLEHLSSKMTPTWL